MFHQSEAAQNIHTEEKVEAREVEEDHKHWERKAVVKCGSPLKFSPSKVLTKLPNKKNQNFFNIFRWGKGPFRASTLLVFVAKYYRLL
jgi:hypothetical protein